MKFKRLLVAAAVVAGSIGVLSTDVSANTVVTNPPWRPGRGVVSATGGGGAYSVCTAGPWFTDQTTNTRYMALPAHCVYLTNGSSLLKSLPSKYYKVQFADGTNNSFDDSATNSFVKPTGAYSGYDIVLVRDDSSPHAYTFEGADYRFSTNTIGAGPWAGGSQSLSNGGAILRSFGSVLFDDQDQAIGYHACKTGIRGGTDCGLVYGSGTFNTPASTDWVTPVIKIDLDDDSHGEGCKSADGDSGAPVWIPSEDISLNTRGKNPLLGMVLGVSDSFTSTDSRCYSGSTTVGDDLRVVTTETIIEAYASQLNLIPLEDSWQLAGYPRNQTLTIGNVAITGTTNTVSCWQAFNDSYGEGVSILNCYRYNNLGVAISNDSYTLDKYCSTVSWIFGTSNLSVRNTDYYYGDLDYPFIGYNGDTHGCYKGTDQSGSAAWYASYTRFTATCQPGNTSGCSIQSDGYSGGSYWNSPGVSRDTYPGWGGYNWPDARGVYTRILYTQ